MLVWRLAWNHALIAGNKRAAWAALVMFVELNQGSWDPDPPDVDQAAGLLDGSGIPLTDPFVSVVNGSKTKGEWAMRHTNEAGWDRIARIVLGAALLYLGWSGTVDGGLGDFLKVFGFVPLLTGVVGWCPIYAAFGFRTNAKRSGEPAATA